MKRFRSFLLLADSGIWKRRSFIRLWSAQSISLLGDQIYLIALPLLVYDLTRSGSQMSAVYAVEMLPFLFFSVMGGVVSDKWGHKPSLMWGNVAAGAPLACVFLLYMTGQLQVWHIYLSSFTLSCLVAVILPAFEASIPSMVPKDELVEANSLTEISSSATLMLGPAAAGALVAVIGSGSAVLLNALSFLAAGLIFASIKMARPSEDSRRTLGAVITSFKEGIAYVPKHRILRWGVFMSTSGNIILGAYNAVLIFYMRDRLGLSASAIGVVLTVSNIVPLAVSGMITAPLSRRFNQGALMIVGLMLQGGGVILVGLSKSMATLICAQAIYAGAATLYAINWRAFRQAVTPGSMIGRVSGVCRGIAFTGASLGGFLGAMLLTRLEPSALFIINGSIVMMISFAAAFGPIVSSGSEAETDDLLPT
jgi:MFS family permease